MQVNFFGSNFLPKKFDRTSKLEMFWLSSAFAYSTVSKSMKLSKWWILPLRYFPCLYQCKPSPREVFYLSQLILRECSQKGAAPSKVPDRSSALVPNKLVPCRISYNALSLKPSQANSIMGKNSGELHVQRFFQALFYVYFLTKIVNLQLNFKNLECFHLV